MTNCVPDGGGYGLFSSAGLDPTEFMVTNGNQFIAVTIQYRLGAFGFLSGEDVKEDGVLNAGLLDMNFALQWVQKHITKFGGDPSRVTIAGESAGGAAVMYQAMAYGGKQDKTLFQNVCQTRRVSFVQILTKNTDNHYEPMDSFSV
jgi:carboxylesterase type B